MVLYSYIYLCICNIAHPHPPPPPPPPPHPHTHTPIPIHAQGKQYSSLKLKIDPAVANCMQPPHAHFPWECELTAARPLLLNWVTRSTSQLPLCPVMKTKHISQMQSGVCVRVCVCVCVCACVCVCVCVCDRMTPYGLTHLKGNNITTS